MSVALSNGRRRRPRRVAVVTGTRAEYGLLRSTMRAIEAHPALRLQLIVTGMHLLRPFGRTVRQIERDGWRVDARVPMQRGNDDVLDQARGLSRGIAGIAAFLEQAGTDLVLVLGDRIEALAGALAATTTRRFVAHVHGGDRAPGQFDNAVRDGITKLAHIHCAATRHAARRIIRMGEDMDHVHVVGAPGLDELFECLRNGPCETRFDEALVVQHACGRDAEMERRVMMSILRAVHGCGLNATVIHPNSDRGCSGVLAAMRAASTAWPNGSGVRTVKSLPRDRYLRALIGARVLIGNSSSGIIEAPAAGTPCVNVGARQAGRIRGGRGVFDAGESLSDIRRALTRALAIQLRRSTTTPYGDGNAGKRIAAVLAETELSEVMLRKGNTFRPVRKRS